MSWQGNLQLEFVRGRFAATVSGETCAYEHAGQLLRIPAGFRTDFGSVPGWVVLVCLVPRIGLLRDAFILHDMLYQSGSVSRSEADSIFRAASYALLAEGESWISGKGWLAAWERWGYSVYRRRVDAAYLGIRWFGWIPWWRYRTQDGNT